VKKSEIKDLAVELRGELGVADDIRFDPYELARLYGVDIVTLSSLRGSDASVKYFKSTNPSKFSGALISVGRGMLIIENDAHSCTRRRLTVGHEMSHHVLGHEFKFSLSDETKCRSGSTTQEDDANRLALELLLPTKTAIKLAYNEVSDELIAARFEMSVEAVRWQMNKMTGARTIAKRAAAKRRR
jgi:Zn-dependent peptidase ImmA (M78 family)